MHECGFGHPPPEDSPDREAMDAFADFLRIIDQAPRDANGRFVIPKQAYDYATGKAARPAEPGAGR